MYALDPVYPEVVRGPCLSLHRKEELAMDGGNQIFFFFFFGNQILVIPVLSGHASN